MGWLKRAFGKKQSEGETKNDPDTKTKDDTLTLGLQKSQQGFFKKLTSFKFLGKRLNDDDLENIEELLLSTDMGPDLANRLVERVSEAYQDKAFKQAEDFSQFLHEELSRYLRRHPIDLQKPETPPTVILVCGVNGSGKTTSIAKLATFFKQQGQKVLLAAGDTFRAAATEQLQLWAERIGVEVIAGPPGSDPASIVHDACDAAQARGCDLLIIDTSGRLHTDRKLMAELDKIKRVVSKKIKDAPHESLLVLDATAGQNALSQAQGFSQAANLSGLILAKLDGTARGGIVLAINETLNLPVKFVGTGEGAGDFAVFDVEHFVSVLLSPPPASE